MRMVLKWVIQAKQVEAAPTLWKATLFKLSAEGNGEPTYQQTLKFTASKDVLDEMEFDLNAGSGSNRVEVSLKFENKLSTRVAIKPDVVPG